VNLSYSTLNRFVEEKIGADPAYRTVIEKNGRPYLSLARSMSDARDNAMKQEKAGLGCMSISANYGPAADKAQGIQVIRTAHESLLYFLGTVGGIA
jgi:hypothetical protein